MTVPGMIPISASTSHSEQAVLKVLWEDEMKAVNTYVHHKHVVALLLSWENIEGWTDMGGTEEEVHRQLLFND